jgi:mannose-6-phosphate isomerase-like protein (cupin superfamily)
VELDRIVADHRYDGVEPGTGIPLHTHNVEECVLVLNGEATVTIGDDTFDVSAGAGTWVPADVPHGSSTAVIRGCASTGCTAGRR